MATLSHFKIPDKLNGERLDQAMLMLIPGYSRSSFKKMIQSGAVLCNGKPVTKAGAIVSGGDTLEVSIPDPVTMEAVPMSIPLDILYEDDDVLVVNKPKNMVVHPAAGHLNDTLVNAILAHCGDSLSGIGGVLRPGIVHRIDKDTTGALLICKNDRAHLSLSEQLKEHSVEREYAAIVCGLIKEDEGTINKPIGRNEKDRKKMSVVTKEHKGKEAITHYRVVHRYERDKYSYITCHLETGRTHQIRVHMLSIGHPLLGDTVYAPKQKTAFSNLQGQCLHAKTLGFTHPVSRKRILVEAPLPAYFQNLLEVLK